MGIVRGAEPSGKFPRPRAPLFQDRPAAAIRRAGSGDLDAIVEMRIEFERITRDSGTMDEAARRAELSALLGPDLESGAFLAWIVEVEGRAVGQAALRLLSGAPTPAGGGRSRADGREAELMNVYVRPTYRRLGLGTALVAAALGEARARLLDRITLQPTDDSRRIYERAGFRPEGGRMILDLRS